MNKYKTLLNNTVLISIGTFGSKLLVFLMVRFYTGCLTPADYSTADLVTQTANLLMPVISLGITDGVFRFAIDHVRDRGQILSSGFRLITVGMLALAALSPLCGLLIGGYGWLIFLYTAAACYHSLFAQYVRAEGNTKLFAVQGLLNTALVVSLNVLFLAGLHLGISGYVLSIVLADTVCAVILVCREKLWRCFRRPNPILTRQMLKYSIPLIPTTVFWWVTSVSDRYMVASFVGSDANGIYTVAYKIPTVMILVSSVFTEAWQLSAVTEARGSRREHLRFYSRVWRSFQAVMFLCGSLLIALSKPLVRILAADSYQDAWRYVPVLCAAMVFAAFVTFFGSVYMVKRTSKLSLLTSAAGAVINFLLNLLLIPSPLGIQGAAIATLASYGVALILRMHSVRKLLPFHQYRRHLLENTGILGVQIVFMVLELPFWLPVQILCVCALIAVNFRFLLSAFFRITDTLTERHGK